MDKNSSEQSTQELNIVVTSKGGPGNEGKISRPYFPSFSVPVTPACACDRKDEARAKQMDRTIVMDHAAANATQGIHNKNVHSDE
jgi:hypothetical protein